MDITQVSLNGGNTQDLHFDAPWIVHMAQENTGNSDPARKR